MKFFEKREDFEYIYFRLWFIKFRFSVQKRVQKKLKKYNIDFKGNSPFKHEGCFILGKNNVVTTNRGGGKILSSYSKIAGLELLINGNNNSIYIEEPQNFIKTRLIITGDNNNVEIKKSKYKIENSIIQVSNGNTLKIGEDFSVATDLNIIAFGRNKKIIIGNDCMLSGFIWIRNDDSHKVLNNCDEPINPPKDVVIGNHVWITHGVIIGKGVCIPDNSIIGTGAVVTKRFDEQSTAIAGNPAKVIKRNIKWIRDVY